MADKVNPKPPISPVPATLTLPVINAADAVISPFSFTLKWDVEININFESSSPPKLGEPLMTICFSVFPAGDENEDESVANPPIKPADAVMVPVNVAPLAIRIPSLSTIKFGPILM